MRLIGFFYILGLVSLSAISFGQGNFQIVKPLINSQNVYHQETTIIRVPSEKSTDLVWLSFKYGTTVDAGLEFATSHDGEQWSDWKKVLVDSHSTSSKWSQYHAGCSFHLQDYIFPLHPRTSRSPWLPKSIPRPEA